LKELYEGEENYYLVLELLKGPTLYKYLKTFEGHLPESDVQCIMKVDYLVN
jgi:serine/threonine protein kinase